MGELFEGAPAQLPEPMARGTALYRPIQEQPQPVRHVGGYEPFIEFCRGMGLQPAELAGDAIRLLRFLRQAAPDIVNDGGLKNAAAVFAGNALARMRPDAEWKAYEGGAPTVGTEELQFEVDHFMDGLNIADDAAVEGLFAQVSEWARSEPNPPMMQPQPTSRRTDRSYVRPALRMDTYDAEDGTAIPYGHRWGEDGPDPDSYSVISHPERFAGLHVVARALIDHLVAVYDVEVLDDKALAADTMIEARDVVAAVRLTPRVSDAAPLTFILTGFPGVVVHAGVLHDFPFPVCGCDACDETVLTQADRLERLVLSVAAGGYAERYPVGGRRWREYALTAFDGSGSESGKGEPGLLSPSRLRKAELRLKDVERGWSPWPLRQH
ncbi:hypothetical protein NtRootA9_32700 [Arthrobacter sp. NtRootA9]|nr:hypothetical protein NtRootA9_32700 [Arthrobacter sp. NtRootA9]